MSDEDKPADKPAPTYNRQLFGEIEKFITLKILDTDYTVPLKLELLRVFQFLDFEIDYARLCWNGSCQRCVVSFCVHSGSQADLESKKLEGLACRLRSQEQMEIKKLPATIKVLKPLP